MLDQKYNLSVDIQYLDDQEQIVLVDTELALKKAKLQAIRDNYYD